jgi:hypothetical protein
MDDQELDIPAIAKQLNSRAANHAIGQLQAIRTRINGFSRQPSSTVFSSQTTHSDWAFHHGGRKELQFNIGAEELSGDLELRHGVAFSFELSQTLPSIDVLVPKARLFNDYLQLYPEQYADMRMWHYRDGERSSNYPPGPIMPELVTPGVFVFLGKRQPANAINYEIALNDFDRLLPLYEYVESGGTEHAGEMDPSDRFEFCPGVTERSPIATASLAERELNLNLKHNILQAALCRKLISEFGAQNVADEHPSNLGTKIDVVLRRSTSQFWYYEIKTSASPRGCLREALGQLLEYAYWPGAQEADRLIICGESPLDDAGAEYLGRLKQRFRLPIEYEQIIPLSKASVMARVVLPEA